MEENEMYHVLLYYNFVPIEDEEAFATEHLEACKSLGLKGRILVSKDGINGTVSGPVSQTDAYIEMMRADKRFKDTVFKTDEHEGHAFKKMHVRAREEVVTLRLKEDEDTNPNELSAPYLSPVEFYEEMHAADTIILDTRNDYEYDVGHFRGAIRPDIKNFRDFPEWVEENKDALDGKRVLTYCTGGIRCAKVTGWMMDKGLDVAQLDGGIVTYGKDPEVQGKLWDGQCYVFDERLTVPINQTEHVIVGRDHFDGTPCERYVNCAEPECNEQFLCSEENEHKYMRGCTHACRVDPRNRYIIEHDLSEEEVARRLKIIEQESLVTSV